MVVVECALLGIVSCHCPSSWPDFCIHLRLLSACLHRRPFVCSIVPQNTSAAGVLWAGDIAPTRERSFCLGVFVCSHFLTVLGDTYLFGNIFWAVLISLPYFFCGSGNRQVGYQMRDDHGTCVIPAGLKHETCQVTIEKYP